MEEKLKTAYIKINSLILRRLLTSKKYYAINKFNEKLPFAELFVKYFIHTLPPSLISMTAYLTTS